MKKYYKLSAEDKVFIHRMKIEYNLTDNAIALQFYKRGVTHEELYFQYVADEKLVLELQAYFVDKRPCEIGHLFEINPYHAYSFIARLYSQDLRRPLNQNFIKRCKYVENKLSKIKD